MDGNAKKTEYDGGNSVFFVEGAAFSAICKSKEANWGILGMVVSWGNLLAELMGFSSINNRGINDGAVM